MILEDVDAAPPDVVRSLTVTNTVFLQETVSGTTSMQGCVRSAIRGRCAH